MRQDKRGIIYRFDHFLLDPADRRLIADGAPVELNARYFDALALLVREAGTLVTKDRFMAEVWAGVPVTDEALTQCIRSLRKRLGDDAARPRFIETVPKHGYRFVAPVECGGRTAEAEAANTDPRRTHPSLDILKLSAAGTVGGAAAGLAGGILYGFAAASQPGAAGLSVLLVLTAAALLIATLGAAGVSIGIAAARGAAAWRILGGALGGLAVGAVVSLLARDAFALLVGYAPAQVTGAGEGVLLGAAVGLAVWIGGCRRPSIRRAAIAGTAAGAGAGILIASLGGKLMAGSLALLAARYPGSRIRLDGIGALVSEDGFGPVAEMVTAGLEGALFVAATAAAIMMAQKLIR